MVWSVDKNNLVESVGEKPFELLLHSRIIVGKADHAVHAVLHEDIIVPA